MLLEEKAPPLTAEEQKLCQFLFTLSQKNIQFFVFIKFQQQSARKTHRKTS